ncbi:hypothetical protein Hanom_Chr10g00950471 [Helianthus anomalus]
MGNNLIVIKQVMPLIPLANYGSIESSTAVSIGMSLSLFADFAVYSIFSSPAVMSKYGFYCIRESAKGETVF